MDTVVERCAGLDVHKESVMACVRFPGERGQRRSVQERFGTTSNELIGMSEWLAGFGVTEVVMEATGVYWKPIFYRLEDDGFDAQVVNAAHVKNVPGRKTDRADAAWLARLCEHGLLRASFVPPPDIRRLRDLTRYRKTQSNERTRVAQRIEKVLQDAGIKLSSVASNILGVSGRQMLDALASGQRDPEVLAELARGRLRPKVGQLTEALTGRFGAHHGVMVAEMLAHIDELDASIARITDEIATVIAPHEWAVELLDTIPGINRIGAEIIIAEIGVDMGRFPTAAHLASWAGMCPGNNESAGKHHSGRTRKGSIWLRTVLVEAANAGARSKGSYLSGRFRRIASRRGHQRAAVAVGHTILVICWHVLTTREPFQDLGADFYTARKANPEAETRRLINRLEALGHAVTLQPAN
jgi:transposase